MHAWLVLARFLTVFFLEHSFPAETGAFSHLVQHATDERLSGFVQSSFSGAAFLPKQLVRLLCLHLDSNQDLTDYHEAVELGRLGEQSRVLTRA